MGEGEIHNWEKKRAGVKWREDYNQKRKAGERERGGLESKWTNSRNPPLKK